MKKSRIPLLLIFFLVGFLVPGLAMIVTAPLEFGRRPWTRFDVLVFPEDQYLGEIREILVAAGERPLDRYIATVEIEDFSGRRGVPVGELASRFEVDDPRLDPFVRALPSLFEGRSGEKDVQLVYLPRGEGSIGRRFFQLSRHLGDRTFRLAGWNPFPVFVSGVAALVAIAITLVTASNRRWPILVGLIPVSLYAVTGAYYGFLRGIMIGVIWAFWQDRAAPAEREWLSYGTPLRDNRDYRILLRALAGVTMIALISVLWDEPGTRLQNLVMLLLFLVMIVAISGFSVSLRIRRSGATEHKLFVPRPILAGNGRVRGLQVAFSFVCLVLLLSQGLILLRSRDTDILGAGNTLVIPVPEQIADDTIAASRILEKAGYLVPEQEPLSTTGYLAHRRYQETLVYGGTFSVPDLDEVVALSRFVRDDGRIRDFREPVLTFDYDWVNRQLSPPQQSAYYLITAEGGILIVVPRELSPEYPSAGAVFGRFLALLAVILPLMYGLRLPYASRIGTVGLASRRASQGA